MITKKILFLLIPLALAGCNAIDASADGGYGDYHYHDVLKPHGRTRNVAALRADGRRCERRTGHGDTLADLPGIQSDPNYRNCMGAHGWRFYAYTTAPVYGHHHEEESAEQTPSYSAPHDAFTDNNQLQQRIDDMNTGIAAEAAATAANSQAAADALAAASN